MRRWLILVLLGASASCVPGAQDRSLQQPVGRTHAAPRPVRLGDNRRGSERESSNHRVAEVGASNDTRPASEPVMTCDMPDTPVEALLFASKDSALRARGTQILDDLIACIEYGLLGDQALLVVGFTDPRGPAAYNYALGLERARAVERYLIRRGVPPERIYIASQGDRLARGDAPETWMYDRRVEIRILPPVPLGRRPESPPRAPSIAAE